MHEIRLYRRRFIPNETVYLKNDEIISADKNIIITKWKVLKERADFSHGVSCCFLNEGFKISKFLDKNDKMLFWYCDIINYTQNGNSYTINDLLIDIEVYNDGKVKVLDMNEIADALENNIISAETACEALRKADNLLKIIYSGKFSNYTNYIDKIN